MKGCLTYSSPVASHCLYKQARNNAHRGKPVTGPEMRKSKWKGSLKFQVNQPKKLRAFCQVGNENENLLQTYLIHTQIANILNSYSTDTLTVYLLYVITHIFYKPTPSGWCFLWKKKKNTSFNEVTVFFLFTRNIPEILFKEVIYRKYQSNEKRGTAKYNMRFWYAV